MAGFKIFKVSVKPRDNISSRNTYYNNCKLIATNYIDNKNNTNEYLIIDMFPLKKYNKIKINISDINHNCKHLIIDIINSFALMSFSCELILVDKSDKSFKKISINSYHSVQLINIKTTKYIKYSNYDFGLYNMKKTFKYRIKRFHKSEPSDLKLTNEMEYKILLEKFKYLMDLYNCPWDKKYLIKEYNKYVEFYETYKLEQIALYYNDD